MIHSSLSAMVTLGKWEGDRYIRVNFAENNTATEDFEKLSHDRNIQGDRYTAVSRKVVGKSARDCPERYCGSFWVHCSSKKFERMTREATDICLWVLKESNIIVADNYSRQEVIAAHITFRDCRVHIFPTTFLEMAVYRAIICRFDCMQRWITLTRYTCIAEPHEARGRRSVKC